MGPFRAGRRQRRAANVEPDRRGAQTRGLRGATTFPCLDLPIENGVTSAYLRGVVKTQKNVPRF